MSTFPSKFACRTRTFSTEFKLLGASDVFGAPETRCRPVMGAVNHARHAGHLEPKPTQTTLNDVSLAKANSLKL